MPRIASSENGRFRAQFNEGTFATIRPLKSRRYEKINNLERRDIKFAGLHKPDVFASSPAPGTRRTVPTTAIPAAAEKPAERAHQAPRDATEVRALNRYLQRFLIRPRGLCRAPMITGRAAWRLRWRDRPWRQLRAGSHSSPPRGERTRPITSPKNIGTGDWPYFGETDSPASNAALMGMACD